MTKKKHDGDCYRVAAVLTSFIAAGQNPRLIHATVTGQGRVAGVQFGHAWVELTEDGKKQRMAVDQSNGNDLKMLAWVYRKIGHAVDIREYTPEETLLNMVKHKHFGPWE